MLLTPHVLTGMLFGGYAPEPWMSPFLGVLSYFFLEMTPHLDPSGDSKRAKVIRIVDFSLAFIIFFSVVAMKGLDIKFVLGGIFAAFTYFFFFFIRSSDTENKVLKKLIHVKSKITYTDKSAWGVLIQIAVCVICIALMFNLVDFPTWERVQMNFRSNFFR